QVESSVFINGKIVGAKDQYHKHITLCTKGIPKSQYSILFESYAGHGPQVCDAGPTPPERKTVPEPPYTQAVVGETTFGIWKENIYQLWMDIETLFLLRESIDQNSLRVAKIDQGLRDFTTIVDFELPHDEMLKTIIACRKHIKPLLECTNGSTVPTMYVFGHAHIDVAWLWPLAETERKAARTFSNQLTLINEYKDYKFLQSQPHLYQMVKSRYPELYEQVKKAVKSGQFIPEGGMWVEADTNITGGESLIRQFIHGKRFFQQEFGVDCELLWLPDVFGYSGSLPQIMCGCGVKYFSTHKILWNYNAGDPFPYNTFTWEGIDGTEVLVHLHNDYCSRTDPATMIGRWNERIQKDGFSTRLIPFGHGDGGGGPTRDHIEYIRREKNIEGVPKVLSASPLDYFKYQESTGMPSAKYVGELYFQAHRGTYTSQAHTKLGNRKSEFLLREAEMWCVVAKAMKNSAIPEKELHNTWKTVLLNQFHDILPGSSIHRVYEEAEKAYSDVINTVEGIVNKATSKLVNNSKALTVFNSLSWDRAALVALPAGFGGASDVNGNKLPHQVIDSKTYVEATVPSCGWTTLYPSEPPKQSNMLKSAGNLLENDLLKVRFNNKGEIVSIIDKETGGELAAGLCNSLKMYRDVPTLSDAWDIDSMYQLTPVELKEKADIKVIEAGPLVAKLQVSRNLNNSKLIQEISLCLGSRRVDFHTIIDWQESHKLLKVNFPVNIHANEAVHDIQFGHIRRPNHYSRQFDADRFEVCNHKWTALMEENHGCALLNDCKYGVNVLHNSINLTLLKSALAPDMTADKGRQEFTYSFYSWKGSFADSRVIKESYELNCPIVTVKGKGGEVSNFSVDAPNVIIETVKPAEENLNSVVVRLYESKRTATQCTLTTSLSFVDAYQTDMLEKIKKKIAGKGNKITISFRPFEIKTIMFTRS
ncbi:MAG: glycoside hydrolase family 38 C-terminal domain-containing protein, partial [Planctomycetota bacterium]